MERKPDIQIILDSDKLGRIDPWSIDVQRELERLLRALGDRINLLICGVAAENSAYIHWKKVEEIMKLREQSRKRVIVRKAAETLKEPPPLRVLLTGGKMTFIDLTEALATLVDLLQETNPEGVSVTTEDLPVMVEDFINRVHEASLEVLSAINRQYELEGGAVHLSFLVRKIGVLDPVEIFILILFLFVEELVEMEVLEDEGVVYDLLISPSSG